MPTLDENTPAPTISATSASAARGLPTIRRLRLIALELPLGSSRMRVSSCSLPVRPDAFGPSGSGRRLRGLAGSRAARCRLDLHALPADQPVPRLRPLERAERKPLGLLRDGSRRAHDLGGGGSSGR